LPERLVRFRAPDGQVAWGLVQEQEVLPLLAPPFGLPHRDAPIAIHERLPAGPSLALADCEPLAPCRPSKIVGVGTNYRAHAEEMGRTLPSVPKVFLKAPSAVADPGSPILIPPRTKRVDHEAELAVVIARVTSRVREEDALDHVLGYTAANDVTARDFQRADGVFARGKGFDTFCPLGPSIALGLDPSDLRVRAWVNGELRQDGTTADMVFSVPELIAFVSEVMTLFPGDVILTGTPAGVGPLEDGDEVVVEVEEVGRLHSPVFDRDDRG